MSAFEPQDPGFEARVRASFARQKVMRTIGASLTKGAPGEVEIELPFRDALTQQHGYLHAGIVTSIVDSACGYAAMTLMPVDASVVSIEFKINFVSPAVGTRMVARGHVTKPGRTIIVCSGDVFALSNGKEKLVATMLATVMTLRDRPELSR